MAGNSQGNWLDYQKGVSFFFFFLMDHGYGIERGKKKKKKEWEGLGNQGSNF